MSYNNFHYYTNSEIIQAVDEPLNLELRNAKDKHEF